MAYLWAEVEWQEEPRVAGLAAMPRGVQPLRLQWLGEGAARRGVPAEAEDTGGGLRQGRVLGVGPRILEGDHRIMKDFIRFDPFLARTPWVLLKVCMQKAPQASFGMVRTTKEEFESLEKSAWWMHEAPLGAIVFIHFLIPEGLAKGSSVWASVQKGWGYNNKRFTKSTSLSKFHDSGHPSPSGFIGGELLRCMEESDLRAYFGGEKELEAARAAAAEKPKAKATEVADPMEAEKERVKKMSVKELKAYLDRLRKGLESWFWVFKSAS